MGKRLSANFWRMFPSHGKVVRMVVVSRVEDGRAYGHVCWAAQSFH